MIKPTIAITLGDPTGIGPEIVKKAISDKSVLKICRPVVIGTSTKFVQGFPSRKSARAAISFLIRALKLVKKKKVDAIVTAPASKSAFVKSGGHTEFLAKKTASKNAEMLMVSVDRKVLLLTRHIPLKDVSRNISKEKIVKSTSSVCEFIKKYFKIKKPKI
ncbi:MAG: 4-hydroxythreonine-4-phosphate dehydrogenase PdxA, partial [Elusimicrobiota bacterium]|nr:4-hydroxythreonine-4-phosphate dehydrogenase PdxA [Elusimicrobiota bacterium]